MKIFFIWCIIFTITLCGSSALGQDFGQLLDAVNKLEVSLKKLVTAESAVRELKFAEFQVKLDALSNTNSNSNDLSQIKAELAELKLQNNKRAIKSTISESQVMELLNEVELSKAEINHLKDLMDTNPTLLVSLEGGVVSKKTSNDSQYEKLNDQIEDLNARLKILNKPAQKLTIPKTTVNGRMYSHGMVDFSDDNENYNEFALSRAYVTLKSKLSNYASVRITSDLRSIDNKYNIILKYAYLDWKPAFTKSYAKLRFGLQPTLYIDQMNKLWGRRYVEKTVSDKRKFLTSSDLGISTTLGFGSKSKYGFVNIALLNGTSYTHVQELNSNKDISLVGLVKPLKDLKAFSKSTLMLQLYSGTQNKALDDITSVDTVSALWDTTVTVVSASDWKRQIVSFGGLLAWNSTLDFGFDMNFTTVGTGAGESAVKKQGLSFFSTFYLKKLVNNNSFMNSINFFGRVDIYDPNTSNIDDGTTWGILGIESVPVKGFKVALNYRFTNYENVAKDGDNTMYVNTLFKF